jgi:hypothetical protein
MTKFNEIWKETFVLSFSDPEYEIRVMPKGSKIVHYEIQKRDYCIWFQCDPLAEKVQRAFIIIGTGYPFDAENLSHVASFVDGSFVWHLMERVK